jgi:transcriptional regulator with XRE-family HTH domain
VEGTDSSLGRTIMAARIEQGMKRSDLAEATGLSYTFLSEIERGIKRGSEKSLYLIAEALGMRPSELLLRAEILSDRSGEPTPSASWGPMASSGRRAAAEPMSADGGRVRGLQDRIVDRIMGVVTAELNRFLIEELEPLVREEVRAQLGRDATG